MTRTEEQGRHSAAYADRSTAPYAASAPPSVSRPRPRRRTGTTRRATVAVALALCVAVAATFVLQGTRRGAPQQIALPATAGSPAPGDTAPGSPPVARDTLVATDYYWVFDGERIDRRPQLTPDGRRIAWIPESVQAGVAMYRLMVRDLDSDATRDLTPDPGFQYSSPRWSPDGRSLAFVRYRRQADAPAPSEVWRIDAEGGQALLLYRSPPALAGPGASGPAIILGSWSPDGGAIALGPTIWGSTGGDTGARVLTDGSEQILPPPSLAPQQVAPTAPPQMLPGTPPAPLTGEWAHAVIVATSPDGRRIALIRSASDAPRSGYWRDGELHVLTLTGPGAIP